MMSDPESESNNSSTPMSSDIQPENQVPKTKSVEENVGEQSNDSGVGSGGGDAEKKLAHYKRLIVQSRQMLENYQKQLSDKDKNLNSIKTENNELIERLKMQSVLEQKKLAAQAQAQANSGNLRNPLRARRRVNDDDDSIWVLFEFDDDIVEWRRFSDEVAINDYVRRDTGEPIVLPSASLAPHEAAALIERSEKSVAKITDEFKRFRVRSEIMRKQKDAEAKQASSISLQTQRRQIQSGSTTDGHGADENEKRANKAEAQVDTLLEEMAEKEEKWQRIVGELKREKEKMLSEGSEAPIATQWRQRFEQCQKEKNDLLSKLKHMEAQAQINGGNGGSFPPSPSSSDHNSSSSSSDMPRRFAELRDEYKLYRKRAMEAIAEKEMTIASLKGSPMTPGVLGRSGSIPEDPKLQYLKNLMLKYLSTDEFEAKEHMERAITTVLLFTEAERSFVAERRADASASWLVNWMGNQTNA